MNAHEPEEIELFLFPLPYVSLFPKTTKPLNIFEPRYLQMVQDAIESNALIALVYSDPAQSSREQGALAHLRAIAGCGEPRIFERRPDGTLLIVIEGRCKVKLQSLVATDKPYLIAKAVVLEEDTAFDNANVFFMNRLMKRLKAWSDALLADEEERNAFWDRLETAEEKINAYCALVIEDSESRQSLLELNDLNERLRMATSLMETNSTTH